MFCALLFLNRVVVKSDSSSLAVGNSVLCSQLCSGRHRIVTHNARVRKRLPLSVQSRGDFPVIETRCAYDPYLQHLIVHFVFFCPRLPLYLLSRQLSNYTNITACHPRALSTYFEREAESRCAPGGECPYLLLSPPSASHGNLYRLAIQEASPALSSKSNRTGRQ